MVDVALATAAYLVAVGFLGRLVGAVDHRYRRLGVAALVRVQQGRQLLGRRVLVAPPRQNTIDRRHQ